MPPHLMVFVITVANELSNIEGTASLFSYSLLKLKVPTPSISN